MPFAGQSGEDELDLLALATDRDLDVVEQAPGDVHGSFEPLVFPLGGRPDAAHRRINIGTALVVGLRGLEGGPKEF